MVEWNDLAGLEAALAPRDVALVLTEPALTNVGIVHPEPGFHDALRMLTRDTGTLLAIDETHTICCGPGGFTKAHGLEPDLVTIGKPIAGGIPASAYGFTVELADRVAASIELEDVDVGGVGGTLAANALSLAAMRATLAEVLTDEAFARMIPLAERWTTGVEDAIAETSLPWHVTRLGCRAEYLFGRDGRGTAARRTRPATSGSSASCTSTRSTGGLAHPVPQHGADVACDGRVRRRPPHGGLSGGGAGAHALTKKAQFANIARDGLLRRRSGRH